jgi:hypothetical protein
MAPLDACPYNLSTHINEWKRVPKMDVLRKKTEMNIPQILEN